jgi:acyl carrier protein
MDEALIYAKLTEIVHDVLDDDGIVLTPELSAKQVRGWDSLAHLRLMLTIEKSFHIAFSTEEMSKRGRIGDLVGRIQARLQSHPVRQE